LWGGGTLMGALVNLKPQNSGLLGEGPSRNHKCKRVCDSAKSLRIARNY
jgi:hypothetical protein